MKNKIIILFLFFTSAVFAQKIWTTSPTYPTQTDQIAITFDITLSTDSRKPINYTNDLYVYTGVTTQAGRWQHVIADWSVNLSQAKLTRISPNVYQLLINNPRQYYSYKTQILASENITELCLVVRSYDGTKQTEDIIIPLYTSGISVVFNSPVVNVSFGDPLRSPVFVSTGGTVPISVSTSAIDTKTKSVQLFVNGEQKVERTTDTLSYVFNANDYSSGSNEVKVIATDTADVTDTKTFIIMRNPEIKNLPIPSGSQIGVNYNTRVLALYAPGKKFIYLIGDHSDWKVDPLWFMNRDNSTPDSLWWINMPSSIADPPGEIAYQFLIDGSLRIYDPYTDKILDPANDQYIPSTVYPNLKSYPTQKTSGIVSVLQPYKSTFNWKVPNFIRPSKEKLVIYELLVRDFVSTHSYKTLVDTLSYFKKLGVNAIELMPISEFEGNNSWGYNPMTYFAPDKYYGTIDDLKNFIDACHQNGIAVIQDIVLNHAYNSNSMVQMYWDIVNSRPASNNPWFNVKSNFANPDAQWGNDFNHESPATQYFVDRVLQYWLTEFKIDGFRFDFTKGFSNTPKPATGDIWGSIYDAARVRLLERMVDKVWSYDPTAIIIFEHLAENREDQELAQHGNGILMWGNFNYAYNQSTMGYSTGWDFSDISYKKRNWTIPNIDGYMESHDEERLMYKNLQFGNSNGSYNIKTLTTALERIKLAATLFITVPGPKMIWMGGELGYDVSINTNGRLGEKPFAWNYLSNTDRKNLFNTFAALIRLKKYYPAFSSSDFTLNASGAIKSLYINHNSMNVAIIGNFDVSTQNATIAFQNVGKWYEFFTGDSTDVMNASTSITLQPGEYRIYTSVRIPKASELATDVKNETAIPTSFQLNQNYPNPFNPSTVISYQLPAGTHVSLKIYDLLGREVATLVNEFKQAGRYDSQFSIKNYQLPSGVYFYRLQAGNFVQTKKMIILK
ncbi:MAG: alpha-amylase family glycosyl hydrolase [Ignavibacteriales bacterium]|nr:alpha-amylase family glycosyl hydrolase [Ignavibacteriales bacterium]